VYHETGKDFAMRVIAVCAFGVLGAGWIMMTSAAPPKDVDYPFYGGDPGGMRYSTLTQIDAKNVSKLQEVWRYDLGGPGTIENQPIVVNGVLYGVGRDGVYALDAVTGKLKWEYNPPSMAGRNPRGETFWTDGKERRLLIARGPVVEALNADTGKLIPGFGNEGAVNLNDHLRGPAADNRVAMTSPVVIYKDIFITCGGVGEQTPASPGDIRGWDVRSGKLLWTFHTIPYPGEEGYETWPKDGYLKGGGNNDWAGMVLDSKRGAVYVATGSPSDDFYGGERLGNNLYGDSVIAIDATTGKKLWHYQTVHHDLWDDDFAAPPSLMTITRNGKPLDVVVATNKTSYVWVLNRDTAEPVFGADEKPMPKTAVEGDTASPTQPIPRMPPPLSWTSITEKDLTTRTPEAHAYALDKFRTFVNEGQFTPPAYQKETVVAPGFIGGVEWGGIMVDPNAHVAFFNSSNVVCTTAVAERGTPRGGRQGANGGGGAAPDREPHSKYSFSGYHKFVDQEGYPATAAPWGHLTAIDMNTGKFLWRIPFGDYPELVAQGMKGLGGESTGAGVVTASGLLLIGASHSDSKMHVFDTKTGKLIWETQMPFSGVASPATYMVNGRQYIVFATSSGKAPKSPDKGSAVVAYALPQ
jgi:quinoprotein glucose dehydrogenase